MKTLYAILASVVFLVACAAGPLTSTDRDAKPTQCLPENVPPDVLAWLVVGMEVKEFETDDGGPLFGYLELRQGPNEEKAVLVWLHHGDPQSGAIGLLLIDTAPSNPEAPAWMNFAMTTPGGKKVLRFWDKTKACDWKLLLPVS